MAPIRCCFDQTAVWHSDAARGPSTPSFDHLVGAGEQRRRNGEVERFRSSHVDARDELRRKLNRQVGGLAAFENSIHEIGGSAMILGIVHAITYESAGLDIRVLTGDGRQFQGLCKFRYAAKFLDEQEIPQDDPSSDPGGMESLERGLEIGL